MDEQKALQRDWSSLPPELLNHIAKKLSEISDFIRFRIVCTTWLLSTPITDLPTQFPWIMEHHEYRCEPNLRFYCVASDKIHTIHAPKASNKEFHNQSQGYWLAQLWDNSRDIYQLSLINPLNNDEMMLPTFNFNNCPYWLGHQQDQIRKHGVCCALSSPQCERLVFCHVGQDNWHKLTLDSNRENSNHFYLNGMLFTVEDVTGITKVIDITAGSLAFTVPPIQGNLLHGSIYLVEVAGDILRVHRHCDRLGRFSLKYWFDIHRLDINKSGSRCWVKVKNIGNHALFIDRNGGFAHIADDSCGIKENCIYFLKEKYVGIHGRLAYEVERIDLETDTRQCFLCPLKNPVGWFVPKLHHLEA